MTDALFWAKVEITKTCWNWQGAKTRGYGSFRRKGKTYYAHRAAYEEACGKIPNGLPIDHLCRNTVCVNPAHLEPVTTQENLKRQGAAVTHCPKGHEYTSENTYRKKITGYRNCRKCHNEQERKRQLRLAYARV